MKQAWNKLSHFGIEFSRNIQERKTVKLVNRMSVVLCGMMMLFTLMGLLQGLYDILFFSIPFTFAFALPPFLQRRGHLQFAKYYFSFSPVIAVFAICFYNSGGMGDKFFLLTTAMIPVILFRRQRVIIGFFLLNVAVFYFAWWYQSNFPPVKQIPAEFEARYHVLAMMSVFVILFFVLQYFRSGNEDYEKELELRNAEISEKNKDILDSIHYAKRIQRALLASDTLLRKNLPDYFVLYKPKDIVSGDFYWADEISGGKFLLLAGDCTGHGVPGAFMSLLNISILHEITSGMKITQPDAILNIQRDAIIMSLNPEGSEEVSRDGMDAVICSFDFTTKKLEFSCANNPLWLLRGGTITEFRPDKFPIGIHEGEKQPFSLQQTELLPGDIVYIFTDGFADQFGGPRGKKFKYSRLKEILLQHAALPMAEQQKQLEKNFDDWRGDLEQVDDVLLIGVRI